MFEDFARKEPSYKNFLEGDYVHKPDHNFWKYRPLRPGDTYVDCGAYIGRNALYASKCMNKIGRVISIEPMPSMLEHLRKTLELFALDGFVTIVPKCLWERKERVKFRDFIGSGQVNPSGSLEFDAEPLDDVLHELGVEYVDLLSMDLENTEIPVLRGAHEYLSTHRVKNLAVTGYHEPGKLQNIQEIVQILADHGYRIRGIRDESNQHCSEIIYATAE